MLQFFVAKTQRNICFWLILIGTLISAGLLTIIGIGNLTQNSGSYEAVYFLIFALFAFACILVLPNLETLETSETAQSSRNGLFVILFMAVLFRFIAVFAAPTLSTDQFRYTWEGRLITLGISPYQYAPDAAALQPYRDDFWQLVQQKDTASDYPPLSQLIAVAEYETMGENLLGPKLAAACFDVLTLFALIWLLGLIGLDKRRVILYAWCPLPIIEYGQSGHNDAPMLLLLICTIGLSLQRKPVWAAIVLGLACLAKFTPLFVLPLFVGWWLQNSAKSNREWSWKLWLNRRTLFYPLLTLTVVIIGYIPFIIVGQGAIGSILEYAGSWHDNDAILYTFLYDNTGLFLSKLATLTILGGSVLLLTFHPILSQRLSLPRRIMLVFGVTLLIASTVHPWYITWVIVLLPLIWGDFPVFSWWDKAWLVFAATSELIYLTYQRDFSPYNWVKPLEYWPPYIAAAWVLIITFRTYFSSSKLQDGLAKLSQPENRSSIR